jgi:hypothetical protein
LRRKLLTLAVLALAAVALYAFAGFFLAPRLVEQKLEATVGQQSDLTLAIGAAKVNPFTLTLSLDDVTLFRRQNTPEVSIDGVDARIRPASLSERSLILRDVVIRGLEIADIQSQEAFLTVPGITTAALVMGSSRHAISAGTARLESPQLQLQRRADGILNLRHEFTSLLPHQAAAGAGGARFEISGGTVEFTDRSVPTPVRLSIDDIDGTIVRRGIGQETATAISVKGRVSDMGRGEIAVEWLPARPHEATRIELGLHDVEIAALSPYIAEVIGRHILAGRMDLTMQLVLDEAELDLTNLLVIRDLQLGGRVDSPVAPDLPVELAAALLEDRDGTIAVRVPVARRLLDAGETPARVFAHALTDYIAAVAATPFERLAELAGRPDLDLDRFGFPPGSADITDDSRAKLTALDRALELRPKLGLTVYPGFDPATDRHALGTQQIRLHINLATATSAAMPDRAAAKPVDFDDPKVRSVLDEFAATRLPQWQQAAIAERFPGRDAAFYRAVFRALVDNEEVARPALERLARYRARSIVEELVSAGNENSRIRLAETTDSTGGVVRLEVRHQDRPAPSTVGPPL